MVIRLVHVPPMGVVSVVKKCVVYVIPARIHLRLSVLEIYLTLHPHLRETGLFDMLKATTCGIGAILEELLLGAASHDIVVRLLRRRLEKQLIGRVLG